MVDAAFDQELVAALPKLRRFAFGLTGSIDEGDDLVQAACERALARRDQYKPGTRLVSWMYRIVQTVWIDRLRHRRRGPTVMDPTALADLPGGDAAAEMESRLALAEVRRAINRVSASMVVGHRGQMRCFPPLPVILTEAPRRSTSPIRS